MGLDDAPPRVEPGCPRPARITQPRFNPLLCGPGLEVQQPDEYLIYVLVVPKERLQEFEGYEFRTAPQEEWCGSAGTYGTTAQAVYLSQEEALDSKLLARNLAQGIGLDPNRLRTDR